VHHIVKERQWLQDSAIVAAAAIALLPLVLADPIVGSTGFDIKGIPFAILAALLIAFRRHRTEVLLPCAVAVTSISGLLGGRPVLMFVATLVLLYTFCLTTSRPVAIAAGVATTVVLYVSALIDQDVPANGPGVIVIPAWGAATVAMADAVRSRRSERAAVAQQLEQRAIDERLTIARELHDLLGHSLSVINVHTAVAAHLLRTDVDQAEESLLLARTAGRSMLEEVRGLLAVLRHDGDDVPIDALPTIDALDDLVSTMRSSGLDVVLTIHGAQRDLSRAVSLTAYRLAQESLTNALKHGTGSAWLTVRYDERTIRLTVTNSAHGDRDHQTTNGHGLVGIRERVAAVGGTVTIGDHGDRFVVDATLPVQPTDQS
jgi:signal transduction histidine kinase